VESLNLNLKINRAVDFSRCPKKIFQLVAPHPIQYILYGAGLGSGGPSGYHTILYILHGGARHTFCMGFDWGIRPLKDPHA
jgi:hypothetical protein